MMLRPNTTYPRLLVAALTALLVVASAPTKACAETADKVRVPVVANFTVDGQPSGAFAQGEDITFDLMCTLPEDIEGFYAYEHMPYWMVVSYDEGFTYVDGSANAIFVRAENGEEVNMTSQLRITSDTNYRRLVVGTPNITRSVRVTNSRVVRPAAGDRIHLTYRLRLNSHARIGYAQGNVVRAHIEYQRPASVDERIAADASMQAASITVLGPSSVASDIRSANVMSMAAMADDPAATSDGTIIAPLADGREGELTSTPEIVSHVYTHRIDITAVDGTTGEHLPGACYALREGTNGAWFVEDEAWSGEQEDATVVTTDENGHASFMVIGSGTYTLVDVEPLDGYDAVSPTSITITPRISADATVLTASSDDSAVAGTDAQSGVVAVTMRHYVHGERDASAAGTTDGANGSNNGNDNGNGNRSLLAHLARRFGGRLPQTGDLVAHYTTVAALSVLALLGGLALRRRERGGTNTHRMSSHGGWVDATEGNDHGC